MVGYTRMSDVLYFCYRVIWKALTVANPHVRYPVVPDHLFSWIILRLLPKRMLDKMIAKNLGFLT